MLHDLDLGGVSVRGAVLVFPPTRLTGLDITCSIVHGELTGAAQPDFPLINRIARVRSP